MNNTIDILQKLISLKSLTPEDAGCQDFIADYLKDIGFTIEVKEFNNVKNMIARYGTKSPVFAFVGHTDVVAVGDITKWKTDPFQLTEDNGILYGRGTSDMKGSIACMLNSIKKFIHHNKDFDGSIVMILTSDEEGPAQNGIKKLVNDNILESYDIEMCLVGEPSSKTKLGDTIKNGRRGSLSAKLQIKGVQGHIAYPHNALNPIHKFTPALDDLINHEYDSGNQYFPPTSFQVSNLNSGIGLSNVIPGILDIEFNVRYSTETNDSEIKKTVLNTLKKHNLDYTIEWQHSGEPYLTTKKDFLDCCIKAIEYETKDTPDVTTDGGTSDGRFMAKICDQVIEFGLINKSIHKINEHTTVNDIQKLSRIYEDILSNIFNHR